LNNVKLKNHQIFKIEIDVYEVHNQIMFVIENIKIAFIIINNFRRMKK